MLRRGGERRRGKRGGGGKEKGGECGEKENGSGRTEENLIHMIPNSSSVHWC